MGPLFLFLAISAFAETNCTLADVQILENSVLNQFMSLNESLLELARYRNCVGEKEEISASEWPAIREKLWNDNRLRNTHPGYDCNSRAALLSLELDRLGYRSEKLYITGDILAFLPDGSGVRAFSYGSHLVNVVRIRKDGRTALMAVDPMFTGEAMPLDEYLDLLKSPAARAELESKLVSQVAEPGMTLLSRRDYAAEAGKEACRYSNAYLERHEDILKANEVKARLGGGRGLFFPTKTRAERLMNFLHQKLFIEPIQPELDSELYNDIVRYYDSIEYGDAAKEAFQKKYRARP